MYVRTSSCLCSQDAMKEAQGGKGKKEAARSSTRRIPPACDNGRRMVRVTVATGAILPIWKDITQTVLAHKKSQKDDPLRVVQAETDAADGAPSKRIVGMEVKDETALRELKARCAAKAAGGGSGTGASGSSSGSASASLGAGCVGGC